MFPEQDPRAARPLRPMRKCDSTTGLVRYATALPELYSMSYGSAARGFCKTAVQPNFAWLGTMPMPQANLQRPWEDVCVNCIHTRHLDEREKKNNQTERRNLPFSCIAWEPDGSQLICAAEQCLGRYEDVTFAYDRHIKSLKSPAKCLKWLTTVSCFLVGDEAGAVTLWSKAFSAKMTWQVQSGPVTDVGLGPHDFKFAASSEDKDHSLVIFDTDKKEPDRIIAAHDGPALTVDWHPASSLVASGGEDKMLKVWDARADGPAIVCRPQEGRVSRVRWNPNGNWLAVGGGDSSIKIYDIRKFDVMCQMLGHKKEITSLAWHPVHETMLVSGCNEGALMHWLVGYTHPIASIMKAHKDKVADISWHPSCHVLSSCGFQDQRIKFWMRLDPGVDPSDPVTFRLPGTAEQFQVPRPVVPRYGP